MRQNNDDEGRAGSVPQHPAEEVDELEERVFGRDEADEAEDEEDPAPAIEQNLDSDDLGSADAGDEPSG